MRVEKATQASDDLRSALGRLLPQLSPGAGPPLAAELMEIVATPGASLLVARDDEGAIVGTLTLVCIRTPTGLRAQIEDVVVDASARGHGAGEALVRESIRLAQLAGAKRLELTSRPERDSANRLYTRLGFERRETNVYRLDV